MKQMFLLFFFTSSDMDLCSSVHVPLVRQLHGHRQEQGRLEAAVLRCTSSHHISAEGAAKNFSA